MLSHLGPYKILAPLGAGGMGEVYRARDSRLDREVAIKILPAELSRDPERLRRFEQEARAAGTLSHPNVLTVFDIGSHEGAPYLVTELLEGETLRQHLAGGRLPARRALDIASQVARGLAAAHGKGVVHRDLKPENLFLSPDGRVKILDFGLAKLTQAATSGSQVAEAKTVTGGTEPGTLLGTIGYMAPEQVRGQAVDHRADIFALGAILFEMLSGGRAFHGPTSADTLGAILREDPPELSRSNPALSPALDAVLRHCLEKEPARRVQSAHDLILELELVGGLSSSAFTPASAIPLSSQWRARAPWLALGLVAGAALGALAMGWWARRNQAPTPVTHFQIAPPEGENFNSEDAPVTLSPDGRRLVYRAEGGDLTVRDLGAAEGRALPGTDGAYDPFWSADGQWLGYFVASQMMRIEPGGSVPRPLATVTDGRGASWNRSGTILFNGEPRAGLSRIPAGGGAVQAVTTLDSSRQELGHWRPHFLPDGRHFLYLIHSRDPDAAGIFAGDLESPLKKRISPAVASPQYTAGWLLYTDRSTLYAQPFDAGRLELTGEPRAVADRIITQPRFGSAAFSVAANGTLAYHQTIGESVWQPTWYDREGKPGAAVGQAGDTNLDLAPDGSKLAAQAQDPATGATDIWLIDLERGVRSRFTFDPQDEGGPVWSGDAQHIAYVVEGAEGASIVRKPVNGAGAPRELLRAPYRLEPIDWSLDGRFLLYEADPPGGRIDLLAVQVDAGGPPLSIAATPFAEHSARFSPDGRWVAYVSDESGNEEIYAQPFPPTGAKWQISGSGGDSPRWRADGRALYYVEDGSLQAVDVDGSGPALVPGPARALFATRSLVYEPAPDGRFLVATRVGAEAPITVILNWREGLTREPR